MSVTNDTKERATEALTTSLRLGDLSQINERMFLDLDGPNRHPAFHEDFMPKVRDQLKRLSENPEDPEIQTELTLSISAVVATPEVMELRDRYAESVDSAETLAKKRLLKNLQETPPRLEYELIKQLFGDIDDRAPSSIQRSIEAGDTRSTQFVYFSLSIWPGFMGKGPISTQIRERLSELYDPALLG